MGKKKLEKCAFCGREMENLFRAEQPGVYICHECIEAGHLMIMEMAQQAAQQAQVAADVAANAARQVQQQAGGEGMVDEGAG